MTEDQPPTEKVNNPELNRRIFSCLRVLSIALKDKGAPNIEMQEDEAVLQVDQKELARITPNRIRLAGICDIEDKILMENQPEIKTKSSGFESFIKELGGSLTRLNHLGISYFCSELGQEIETVKNIATQSGFSLYEEDSGNQSQKWFFIGGDL